ncbi:MAG: protein phosphatase 2C domain-containing protein [Bacteroidia bacterium]|nr:protein phosphatase 2C domain-containing protein [Bacteroidia bacterium]MDW8301050.1 PP2C family serine/threonine-protein phosphatase [Bacteroidia bacterium]
MMNNCKFIAAYGSAIGMSHKIHQQPMQDACGYQTWENGWGIAVVCDGAGSSGFSHIGAHLCVGFLIKESAKINWEILVENKSQLKENIFNLLVRTLEYLKAQNYLLDSLSCTVNAVVFSTESLISFHLGDGRAGYCDAKGDWHALFVPHKGEEANQTIFLTSPIWVQEPETWLEVQVIQESYTAFCVLSDGCERASFECMQWNPEKGIYEDINKPYPKFFNPLVQILRQLYQQGKSDREISFMWQEFLKCGNPTLAREIDDKSLILVCKP